MTSVNPTPEQIQALIATGPEGPIVMVNLLKYRKRAAYPADRPEAKDNLTGHEAYQRYGAVALSHVVASGGGIVWGGPQALVVVGGSEQQWDEIICVRYPSREAFLKMVSNPDYLAASYHREAALERAALLCCAAGTAS